MAKFVSDPEAAKVFCHWNKEQCKDAVCRVFLTRLIFLENLLPQPFCVFFVVFSQICIVTSFRR